MKTLVIGAGAVGRGFVAPLLAAHGAVVDFVDTNPALLAALSTRRSYLTAVAGPRGHVFTRVGYGCASAPEALTEVTQYDAVFVSTGPRQFMACAPLLRDARAVFVLENLRTAALQLREETGNAGIRFGIPEAVVSNTAPPALLARDPLCVVAERGDLILERGGEPLDLGTGVIWADPSELERRWACKFFIHNASHAVAGFLGTLAGYHLIHEAMADPRIAPVVENTIGSVTRALIDRGRVDAPFAISYMERELQRFRNPLLHDPVSRVARDPLRKLGAEDRLMQALRLVVAARQDAYPITTGIAAGLLCHAQTEGRPFGAAGRRNEITLRKICGLSDAGLIRAILDCAEHLQRDFRAPVRASAAR
jgi:mannitol-1-phosphate 5-dehydrogenase